MSAGGPRAAGLGAPLAVLTAVAGAALLAPLLPLPPPDAVDLAARLLPPGAEGHWLGTDPLGRDVLARLLHGLRASLAVGVFGTAVAAGLGTGLGLAAGWRGGLFDTLSMRAVDVLLAFPYVLLALALVAALGPGLWKATLAVAVVNVPFFARTVRGSTRALCGREFVEVARLSGHGEGRILLREVGPNVLPVVIVAVSTTLGWMILETAGLSFLGLGAQPPQADLGSMLADGRRFLGTAPHLALVPGLAILGISIALHRLGDALRDHLDPRLGGVADAAEGVPDQAPVAPGSPAAPASEPLLRVEGLRVDIRGSGRVVDDLSFEVAPGEAVALVGESGSGKTVTALAVLGLTVATGARVEGSVHFAGQELLDLGARARRRLRGNRIAYVPQDPGRSLDPVLRIGVQVTEAVRAHHRVSRGEARRRAAALLERVGLPDAPAWLDAWPHQLSGGMRQRVLLAMALANDPDLLIADEPTTALDVTVQAGLLRLLDEARRERNRALLLITHDLGVVSELCDRVVVLREGRLVESGDVGPLLRAPRAAYTRELLACVPRLGEPERVLRAGAGVR